MERRLSALGNLDRESGRFHTDTIATATDPTPETEAHRSSHQKQTIGSRCDSPRKPKPVTLGQNSCEQVRGQVKGVFVKAKST